MPRWWQDRERERPLLSRASRYHPRCDELRCNALKLVSLSLPSLIVPFFSHFFAAGRACNRVALSRAYACVCAMHPPLVGNDTGNRDSHASLFLLYLDDFRRVSSMEMIERIFPDYHIITSIMLLLERIKECTFLQIFGTSENISVHMARCNFASCLHREAFCRVHFARFSGNPVFPQELQYLKRRNAYVKPIYVNISSVRGKDRERDMASLRIISLHRYRKSKLPRRTYIGKIVNGTR